MTEVTLIGAGLAGSLLAIMLAQKGFNVEVYEKRPDLRKIDIAAGRSINLALSLRGIHALKHIGAADEVLSQAIPMRGRMIHHLEGNIELQPYGKDNSQYINSISRGYLNHFLLDKAESTGKVKFFFNHQCINYDYQNHQLTIQNHLNGELIARQSKPIIGTDGSASILRQSMLGIPGFNFSQYYLEYGYKELTIPPGEGGDFQLEKNALHIWPRETFMLIALPNTDKSFTGTLFLPFKRDNSYENLKTAEQLQPFFEQHFRDVVPLVPQLNEEFFKNPTGHLITIKCSPWHVEDQTLILGDAAHAIVPFFGQGMNSAFEDCCLLMDYIDHFGDDWGEIFEAFSQSRKKDADAIAEMSFVNFIEMRDSVTDPKYLLKRQIEKILESEFPAQFTSGYSKVSFSRMPYSQALKERKSQDVILEKLAEEIQSIDELDIVQAHQMLKIVE